MMPWRIDVAGREVRVTVTGVLDVFDAPAFCRDLLGLAADPRSVTIDLSACGGVDTSGIQLLLAFRDARANDALPLSIVDAAGRAGRMCARFGLAAG